MGLKLNTASGGSVSIEPTNTASNYTLTVPAATTTVVGTDTTQTLTNKTLTNPTIDSAQFATVSGTAPLYACRAWVNFNGTNTVAIRTSGNVSSITDIGSGTYQVNFTNAMPDANYTVNVTTSATQNVSYAGSPTLFHTLPDNQEAPVTGSFKFMTSAGGGTDRPWVCVSVFR